MLKLSAALTMLALSMTCLTNNAYAGEEGAVSGDHFHFKSPMIPVTEDFTLANGMRVILSEDHSVPVASVALVFNVGARDEVKGRSGFAHLFEHMMFEGSENVAKTEHFKFVQGAGGSSNASTHSDFTNYFEKVPSNQLELALWLESDRMRSLKVTPENFENQLQTVKEEKRSHIDNQPYVPAEIKIGETLFDNWANSHPVIGSFEDLDAASVEDVRNFFRTYYAPNNAVMAIVGDIDSNAVHKLVEKYFASIPSHHIPASPSIKEPAQAASKYIKVEDPQAQAPAFWMAWKAPAKRDPDYYTLGIIGSILSTGDSSRLYQRMIKGDEVALQADTTYDERRGPGYFATTVVYKPGVTPERGREVVWSELEKLKSTPVSDVELEKAKNQILRSLFSSNSANSLQRSLARAEMLAEYAAFFGNPSLIDADVTAYLNVSPADVQKVAAKIFTKEGLTVVDDIPIKKASPERSDNKKTN